MGQAKSNWLQRFGNWANNAVNDVVDWFNEKRSRYNQTDRDESIEDSSKLMETQLGFNKEAAEHGNQLQKEMIDYTSPAMTIQRYKDAGLNPALLYGSGGGTSGQTTGGQTTAGVSGQGNDASSRMMARNQQAAMGLQLAKLKSEIDLNKSVAETNRAKAGFDKSKTTTEEEQRRSLVEKLTQEGIGKYLENLENKWKVSGDNNESGALSYSGSGKGMTYTLNKNEFVAQEAIWMINKAIADTGNTDAQMLLTNEKAKGYLTELANATAHADAATVQAAAAKLSSEFGTGETINWKNLGEAIVKLLALLTKGR